MNSNIKNRYNGQVTQLDSIGYNLFSFIADGTGGIISFGNLTIPITLERGMMYEISRIVLTVDFFTDTLSQIIYPNYEQFSVRILLSANLNSEFKLFNDLAICTTNGQEILAFAEPFLIETGANDTNTLNLICDGSNSQLLALSTINTAGDHRCGGVITLEGVKYAAGDWYKQRAALFGNFDGSLNDR